MSTDTGKDLMQRFQETGDKATGDRLFSLYRKPLWRFLLLMCGSPTEAEDLSQRVWLKIIKIAERGAYQPQKTAAFRTYLFTIARNLVIDDSRALKARTIHVSDTAVEPMSDKTIIPMERMADTERTSDALVAAMAVLPDEQREVLVMWSEGFGFDEIAGIVKAPRNTVIGRKRYAIEKLRSLLQEPEKRDSDEGRSHE